MLLKIHHIKSLDELDHWGSVTDLGSTLLTGEGKFFGKFTLGSPEESINSAYFGVTKSQFRIDLPIYRASSRSRWGINTYQ